MTIADRPYLSIGEVLGLLLEEFPDVTISKIRFLESQGLIDPERTPSGYRKFYDVDVERLRVILREQRENFLPLKVIRHRLANGEIDDPSGSLTPPRGVRAAAGESSDPTPPHGEGAAAASGYAVGEIGTPAHAVAAIDAEPGGGAEVARATEVEPVIERDPTPVAPMAPLEVPSDAQYSAAELCAAVGITADQLDELTSFGVIANRPANQRYGPGDVAIARCAGALLGHGLEGRHLRAWRQSADREAGLFEQVVMPYLRQRNPASRQQAVGTLEELAQLGGELRAALLHAALQQHLKR